MGVGEDFRALNDSLKIGNRSTISDRYELITGRLNYEFRSLDSKTAHSFYSGSYGRGTAINTISDLDMIYVMPYEYYLNHNAHQNNGQSALLQLVRSAIQKTYSSSSIGADGQVVVVEFKDGITFEIVPAFLNTDGSYTYPDSNSGGRWRSTNPKPEISAIDKIDSASNGNLKCLCKMLRAWKTECSVPMGGLLIDTLAAKFIENWIFKDKSFLYHDFMSRDFFEKIKEEPNQAYWLAVGSNQQVASQGMFQYKALRAYNISCEAIDAAGKGYEWKARQKWREIYGENYPA